VSVIQEQARLNLKCFLCCIFNQYLFSTVLSLFKPTYYSKIYREFQAIDALAYNHIIRFFEEKESKIERLYFEEYFEMLVTYVDALFETGKYQKHLVVVDLVIEASVINNIKIYKGEDIFSKMLFRKAASLFQINKVEEADYILRELLKMDPYNSDAILFLKKCLRRRNAGFMQSVRAVSIFLFLLAALVIAVEVLFVRPFYERFVNLVETSRISIFLLGIIALLGGTFIQRLRIEREVQKFIQSIHRAKDIG
jgi:tetratricopeptide (TPR) repeat protein